MNTKEYLLTCLSEECSEVAKEASKAMRFGLHDKYNGETPLERMIGELNELTCVIVLLMEHGVLPANWSNIDKQLDKRGKLEKYMSYSASKGTLTPEEKDPQ